LVKFSIRSFPYSCSHPDRPGAGRKRFSPSVEAASPLLGLTYLPVVILSGSFGSVGGDAGWVTTAMTYLPVAPIIHGAAHALGADPGVTVLSVRELAVLAAWAAAGLLVSHRWFRWSPRQPGRRRAVPQPS
jgi:ABC-2 type transport system permease protein